MVDLLAELGIEDKPETPTEVVVTEPVAKQPVPEPVPEQSKSKSILDKLLDDIAPVSRISPYRRLVIYGDPGVGKTVLSCGVNCDKKFTEGVLLIAVEPGALSVLNHDELKDSITIMKFKARAQLHALISELQKHPQELEKYHTIVLDTATTLSERHLRSLPLTSAGTADNLKNSDDMKETFRLLTDIDDRNIIVLCHTREDKDESTGRLLVRPSLGPKVMGSLNGMVDCVGYMARTEDAETGANVYTLQVHPKGNVTAKTRIGGLDTTLINPKITDLISEY